MSKKQLLLSRRSFLVGASAAASTLLFGALTGCSSAPGNTTFEGIPTSRVLVAYYSRAGENPTSQGMVNLSVGFTEIMANYIAEALNCEIFQIVPEIPYPADYEDCRLVALHQDATTVYPAIANIAELPSIDDYDIVFLGGPNWFGVPPMVVYTFLRNYDWKGKIIIPFVTNNGGGLGDYQAVFTYMAPGATVSGDGLAVRGEYVEASREQIQTWAKSMVNA